jgi:DNA-binding LacI/PurR family transcriptional regulator
MKIKTKRATIYDIAEQTGVSPSTVSRVMAGSTLIGADVATAINKAADELHYQRRRIRR